MNNVKRSKRITIEENYEKTINEENIKLLNKFLMEKELAGKSLKTIYNYKRDLLQWMSYLNKYQFNISVLTCTEDDIAEFIYFCQKQGNNTERIKRRMSPISSFYIYLKKKKIMKENPLEFIERPKKGLPVVTQTFFTQEQYNLMKQKLEECKNLQLQVYGILSVDTMARVNAISNLKWEQVNFEYRTIDNVLEKEGYIVDLYFDDYTKDLLLKLVEYRKNNNINDNGYIFITKVSDEYKNIAKTTLNLWATKIGNMIGVPTCHPHDFRHSGSQLRKLAGMPIETISELLNHQGLDVTKKFYLRQDKRKTQEIKDKYKI